MKENSVGVSELPEPYGADFEEGGGPIRGHDERSFTAPEFLHSLDGEKLLGSCSCGFEDSIREFGYEKEYGELVTQWWGRAKPENHAEKFGVKVLQQEMEDAGIVHDKDVVEEFHYLLTEPDSDPEDRQWVKAYLEQCGIDVDHLLEALPDSELLKEHFDQCLTCFCNFREIVRETGFVDQHADLVARWDNNDSIRNIQRDFGRELLRQEMERAGMNPDAELVKNRYETLTGDDVDAGDFNRAKAALQNEGVDVDWVLEHIPGHMLIQRHLTECLEREREANAPDTLSASVADERIKGLLGDARNKVKNTIELLEKHETVEIGDEEYQLNIEATVMCRKCNRQIGVSKLIHDGGCACQRD